MFGLDRVHELAPKHAAWKTEQPFKAVLDNDRDAMAGFTEQDWAKIIGATTPFLRLALSCIRERQVCTASKSFRFKVQGSKFEIKGMLIRNLS